MLRICFRAMILPELKYKDKLIISIMMQKRSNVYRLSAYNFLSLHVYMDIFIITQLTVL